MKNQINQDRSGISRNCRVLVAVALLVTSVRADSLNKDWDNGAANNGFSNAVNWNANTLPTTGPGTAGDNLRIDRTGANRAVYSAPLDNPGVGATSANAGTFRTLAIANVSGNGELEITGGVFNTDNTAQTTIGSSGRTGILTVNGASANVRLGGWLALGHSTSGTGVVNVVSGSFNSTRNVTIGAITGVSIALGNGNNARGTIKLSGGQLVTRTGVLLGVPGTTGVGRFEVWGAGVASIGTENAADDGFWVQSSGSTLAAYVTNRTLGQIYVDNLDAATNASVYADGNVIFSPGSKLEVAFVGATNAGSWDLMKWEGALLTNGLSFASVVTDTNWSFAFVDTDGTNGPDTLRLTYISAGPPPPPTGLVAVPGNSLVTLRWTALSSATNYHVKRATSSGGPYTVTNDAGGLSFTNTGLINGTTYYYVITAVTTNGETLNSSEVRAMPDNSKFVHPGVMHTQADLDRMRTKVVAGEQPWLDGYNKLVADSHSSAIYPMQGPYATVTRAGGGDPSVNLSQWENDCGGAYQNALMWYLTGNPAHANKAIAILDAWAGTCTTINGSDARLTAGLQGHKFITAAEIIRYTGAAWSAAQVHTCSNFIRTVLLPLNKMHGGGNWGIIGDISQMAGGVFMEDEAEFNDAINALKFGSAIECDMGIVNYIDPVGWTTEADRDLGHWSLGLNNNAAGAQIAWCQGVDLWSYLGNRILAGHEYIAKYNASNSVSYSPPQQCDGYNNGGITSDGRGRWDIAFYEQAYHPYANLFGVAAPWTWTGVTNTRAWLAGAGSASYPGDNDGIPAEGYDRDHVAFGTLVAALPTRMAGLPVLPSGLTATWSNNFVKLNWNSASNALTYNVKRAVARGGPYTNITTGLAITNCTDATAAHNQLWFYKVSAVNATGETENSGLASAYPSGTAPVAPTVVAAKTISHQRIDVSWNASAGAASYNVKRALASGGPYTNIASSVGTTFLTCANSGLPAATTFHYIVTANNAIGTGGDSTVASATTLPLLPLPWTFADAGYLTTPGNAIHANGAFTVKGAGLDYSGFNNSDSFGLCYLNLTGDGEIVARYASRAIYSNIGKTGLTLRESLGDEAKHMTVYIGDDTATMIYRTSTGGNAGSSGSVAVTGLALPQWLKLNRTGNVFTGSVSPDGTNWTVINSRTNTMNATLLVGFAVCSRNNGFLDTAVFDSVSVTGLWPALPGIPAGLNAAAGDATATLNWTAAANATGYNVKRATISGGPYTLVATNIASLACTNTGLNNGTLYYYVVSGTNFFGESANSGQVSVRPVSIAPTPISAAVVGSTLQLSWPSDHLGWRLEAQTNSVNTGLGTNWFTVSGSSATNQISLPINPANGSVFLRLVYP